MAVAKSYEAWEIVGDVFTDEAGKEWVRVRHSCPRCGVKEGQELTVEEADAIYKKFNQKGCCNGQNHCCF